MRLIDVLIRLTGMAALGFLFILDSMIILVSLRKGRLPRGLVDWIALIGGTVILFKFFD